MLKKLFLSLILGLLITPNGFCAVVLGTNGGFVTATPSGDPAGTEFTVDNSIRAVRDTSAADMDALVEIGLYFSVNPNEGQDWEVGIYSHDAGNDKPNVRLDNVGPIAITAGTGWKNQSITTSLSGSTTYWIALQIDNSGGNTRTDFSTPAGTRRSLRAGISALPSPWTADSSEADNVLYPLYALYTTGAPPAGRTRRFF